MAIRITAEIVPHGYEPAKFKVGELFMWNDRRESKDGTKGVYGYRLTGDWKHFDQEVDEELSSSGYVEVQRDAEGLWQGAAKAIIKAFEGE